MLSKKIFYLLVAVITLSSFSSCNRRNDNEPEIKFETTKGDIIVKLYPETKKTRENFVKLVDEGYYNGMLFYRVIKNFMIQSGDPNSIHARPGQVLGYGDMHYTIPAEIVYPKYYHKKGALAAARQNDDINPTKASSGGQFYIVEGRKYTDKELDMIEQNNKKKLELKLTNEQLTAHKNEMKKYISEKNNKKVDDLRDSISNVVNEEIQKHPTYKFTAQQRHDYKTIGGAPYLDGEYTVFGEVIRGQNVVDLISNVKTDKHDRPYDDVRIIQAVRIR